MPVIKDSFAALKEVFSGSGKYQPSSSTEKTSSTAFKQQEHLDTSNMAKVLVIGETGAGKTTYINYLTNYFRQGSLQNLKVAIPSKFRPNVTEAFSYCEHDIQDTTQSKTDACNQYMFIRNDKQYLFLDTPGLSDTRGAKQDDENIMKIIDSVENLGSLTAVIIVINGAVSRLTVNLRNVIARLRGNLPDIIMSNVILVLTNATRHAANFSLRDLKLNGNIYPYYMQNSAFSQDPSTWNASALEALQCEWNQAMDEIEATVQTIDTFKTKSVTAFKQMKDIRNEIKTQMHAARLQVSEIQKIQDETAAFETAMIQSDSDLVSYKDYTKEREVDKIEIVDAAFHSTLCQNCNHVCHPKCQLDETIAVGAQIFQRCWAMSNGNCRQCQHKCSYTAHYHAKKTVKKSKQKLQDVLAEIKVRYDKAAKDKSDYQQKITSIADAKKLLENALLQKNEEIKQLCIELRRLCSGFNIAQELHALIDQLEAEAAMLKNIEAKQQANTFIRSMKEFCSMLEKDQDLSQNQPWQMNIINTERPVQYQARLSMSAPGNNTPLTMERNSNANTYSVASPDSGSYANDDVLQAIRAISQKKMKKEVNRKSEVTSKKPVPTNESETEEENDSDTVTDESSDEKQSDKEKKKRGKKTTKQPPPNLPVPCTVDADLFKSLTIQELLEQCRTCIDQHRKNFVIHELMQRSHGKSVGPLKSPESVVEFTASSQKYCALGENALRQQYEILKSRIAAITEPDILKIDQVPSRLLFEIAAIYVLLQRAPSDDESPSHNATYNSHPFHPTFHGFNDHSRFANHPQNNHFIGSIPSQSNSASPPQSHLSPHPSISSKSSPLYPHHYCERQYPYTYINEPPPYDNKNSYPHYFPHEQQPQQQPAQFVHNSGTVPLSSSSHDIQRKFDDMRISADHCENVGSSDSNDEIRKMNNSQLLATYNDAYHKHNHAKSNVLYNELKRRCYGDYPLLMHDKKTLFDQIYKTYQSRSLNELKQLQINIHQKIRDYLTDDDATHINDIPTELIVDAGALIHLIAAANSRP